MKVLVVGAGRMGIRHVQGIIELNIVEKIQIVDINETALENVNNIFSKHPYGNKLAFGIKSLVEEKGDKFDIGIMASTANDRLSQFEWMVNMGCENILVEKPLGQSYQEVIDFSEAVSKLPINCFVNLNLRLYDSFIKLKDDMNKKTQLKGKKTISLNTGTLGIGANGIHYLDLFFFLLDADRAKIVAAHIDDAIIPSGRGSQFCDFGGWIVAEFFSKNELVGTVFLSMSSYSTAFGSIEIIAPNGRIYLNEVEQKRIDTVRNEESTMPINRYFADYLPPQETKAISPFLGELTAKWLESIVEGNVLLPTLEESLKTHALMFDWLKHSNTHSDIFPIT